MLRDPYVILELTPQFLGIHLACGVIVQRILCNYKLYIAIATGSAMQYPKPIGDLTVASPAESLRSAWVSGNISND
jgi:hypothetical protein